MSTAPAEDAGAAGGLTAALRLLTVLPAPGTVHSLSSGAAWFPAVGALVGATAGAVAWAGAELAGPLSGAALGVTTLVIVTGGLHQDGLADCADALGARDGAARRLDVMADPRVGTFGALALILWTLLMVAALARVEGPSVVAVLTAAGALGRWAALVHAGLTAPARRDGLGAAFGVSRRAFLVASASLVALAVLGLGRPLVVAAAVAALSGVGSSRWAVGALGGRTGDTLGAAVAVAEVAACLVLAG